MGEHETLPATGNADTGHPAELPDERAAPATGNDESVRTAETAPAKPRRAAGLPFPFRSIRGTLLAWQTILLAAALALFGALVYQREHGMVMKDVDKKLAERAAALLQVVATREDGLLDKLPPSERRHYERGQKDRYYFAVWSGDRTLIAASRDDLSFEPPVAAPSRKPRLLPVVPVELEGPLRQKLFTAADGIQLLVGKRLDAEHHRLAWLAAQLTLAGSGLLLLGLIGGWGLGRLTVRPIERLTAAAGRISATTLSERLDESAAPVELRRLTQILNQAFARLEHSFARQRQFTADASHELRTPLAVVLSQAELALARERTPQEYCEAFAACQRAAQRMKQLTEALLTLSRADDEGFALKRQQFDLAGLVRRVAEWHEPAAEARRIKVELELDQEVACWGDADLLQQAVSNLISNAIRYNIDGGGIGLSVASERGEAVLCVVDTGIGIAPEHQPRVFDRFYRVDPARSRSAGGNGLGLAICKEIVEAHGGNITLISRLGHGSTFEIRLPARGAERGHHLIAGDDRSTAVAHSRAAMPTSKRPPFEL